MNPSIVEHFRGDPSVRLLIGYGSAVIPQTGGDSDKSKLLDLMVVVDDCDGYINSLKEMRLISPTPASFACSVPSEVAYFPHVRIGSTPVGTKLGVVERRRFFDRLQNWNGSFYIPGRLQKPTKVLLADDSVRELFAEYQRRNLQAALASGLLLSPDLRSITDYNLFKAIVSLSYLGDIRMGIAENPRKIDNIVDRQMPLLRDMYQPFFDDVGLCATDSSRWICTKSDRDLWNMLPSPFRQKAVQSADPQLALISTLSNINRRESLHQAFVGVGTAGFSNSAKYLIRKISKRIFS